MAWGPGPSIAPVFRAKTAVGPDVKPGWVGGVLGLDSAVWGQHAGFSHRALGWAAAGGLPTSFPSLGFSYLPYLCVTEQRRGLIADPRHALHPKPAPCRSPLPVGPSPRGRRMGGKYLSRGEKKQKAAPPWCCRAGTGHSFAPGKGGRRGLAAEVACGRGWVVAEEVCRRGGGLQGRWLVCWCSSLTHAQVTRPQR